MGYDRVISQKSDAINKQKFYNNRVMDKLIEKLGYLDYRDALACNKYIMEAKSNQTYHQIARARVLSIAMQRYDNQRKEEIEAIAAEAANPTQ